MSATIGILIPTWDNPQYLNPCIQSILMNATMEDFFRIYIINNGSAHHMDPFRDNPYITILQQERNMGWEGGLKAGLSVSKEPYIIFMNDDTFVPYHQRMWMNKMLGYFSYPDCGAVGPTSNVVMGSQQMFIPSREPSKRVKFLIGFCMLLKRDILDSVGGVDDLLPGGDDLDLSIRLREAGKHLICDRETFIYHHGFKTGERIYGGPANIDGWNSLQKLEKTNQGLIAKHGLRAFIDLWKEEPSESNIIPHTWGNSESDIVKNWVIGEKVAEIGCGDKKLVPGSIGIDMVPKGEILQGMSPGRRSLADITANVEEPLPISEYDTIIATHVLEHTVDAIGAATSWRNALKHGGRLIIAVPDQTIRNTIPLNVEHRHAFTPKSLKRLMETIGMETVDLLDAENNVSFIGIFKRNGA